MNIIDTLLSYVNKFKSEEDRNLFKSDIIKLLQNYADGNTDCLQSFRDLSLIYMNYQGNNDVWLKTFNLTPERSCQEYKNTIKKK